MTVTRNDFKKKKKMWFNNYQNNEIHAVSIKYNIILSLKNKFYFSIFSSSS